MTHSAINSIMSMLSLIDKFYDEKQEIADLLDKGKISLCEYKRRNRELDNKLDAALPATEYNENEEHTLHELKQFSQSK